MSVVINSLVQRSTVALPGRRADVSSCGIGWFYVVRHGFSELVLTRHSPLRFWVLIRSRSSGPGAQSGHRTRAASGRPSVPVRGQPSRPSFGAGAVMVSFCGPDVPGVQVPGFLRLNLI